MSGRINGGGDQFFYKGRPIQGGPNRNKTVTPPQTTTTQKTQPQQHTNDILTGMQILNNALGGVLNNINAQPTQPTQPTTETISPELQAELEQVIADLEGTGCTAKIINGKICIFDEDGNQIEGETIDKITECGGDTEKEIEMMMGYNTDGNQSLNKEEFQTFMTGYLQDAIDLEEVTPEIQAIIDKGFTKLSGDDAEISKDELRQNAETVFNELADEINVLLDSPEDE